MTDFVAFNWIVCILTTGMLVVSLGFERFLLVKPSMWVILWFHFMIQWGATVRSPYIESYLPDPWVFALLVHGFPLVTLCGSVMLARGNAKRIFQRVTGEPRYSEGLLGGIVFVSAVLIAAFVMIYLNQIGLSKTGLYAVVFDPSRSTLAREESLKLIQNPFIKYGFAFMASTVAPIAVGSLAILFAIRIKRGNVVGALFLVPLLLGILVAVSLSGARGFAAKLMVVLVLTYFIKRGYPFRPWYALAGVLAVLLIPTALTLLRENQMLTITLFREYFASIWDRVFIKTMSVGMYYVHHAQTTGFFGVEGIPKFALIAGLEPVDASNIIGLTYVSDVIESISAGASFVFTYYSYFDLWVFPLYCVGVWVLDLALLVYGRLSDNMLLPCIAAVSASTVSFTAADYTAIMVTHGFIPLLVFAYLLDQVCSQRSLLPIQQRLGRHEGLVS